ncbi:MAG TPA: M20/M25/M40 family metallo-hydrolase [Desulfomonilia bacterium]|nr:M20/M25/M40 family metallo-hydrolase [Desulfomonilia bacterium]
MIFVIIGSGVLALAAAVLLRAVIHTPAKEMVEPPAEIALDAKALSTHLLQAIRMQTIPHGDREGYLGEDFAFLHELFETDFPLVHSTLSREKVWEYSLLYTWKGLDERLKPILLMGHLDVVPSELSGEDGPSLSGYDGHISGNYIWGKGAQDDKYAVLGMLEAVEKLLKDGFTPRRTVYLAFGHDEEIGGQGGAFHIGTLLHARGVELEYVLDEGPPITEHILPGISRPVALVGIAEKGNRYIELSVEVEPGHPVIPHQDPAISILSNALYKLAQNPFPARFEKPVRQMFRSLLPRMPFGDRILFANLWLFDPVIRRKLSALPRTNTLIRTIAVPTMFKAGSDGNTLPAKAQAMINLRLLPHDNFHEVLKRVELIINDPRVRIKPLDELTVENTMVSGTDSTGYRTIEWTIRQVFPETLVAPGLFISETDSRYLAPLTASIFRFSPLKLRPESLQRYVHGKEEKISIEDYVQAVKFYLQLIRNSDSLE